MAPKPVDITFFQTQWDFWNEAATTACWIGGRGCGKTFWLALWVADQCMRYPGVRGVVASSTNPQLKQATIPDFKDVFDLIGLEYEYREWNGTMTFMNGSSFKFQSLDVPEDQVKGGNIGFLAVDEVDACPEGHVKKLALACRNPLGSRQRRYIGNSPPPKHWVEYWFVEERAKEQGKRPRGPLYQASTFENYLLPADYIEAALLDNPPGTIDYRRWILGEMGVPLEGQVYSEFEPRHVVTWDQVPWDRQTGECYGLDLGSNHPTVFLRGIITDDDCIYIVDEHAASRTLLHEHAKAIKSIYQWGPIFSDHDAQDRMELQELGVETIPAFKKSKSVGIDSVRRRLRSDRLFIVGSRCPQLISEFPYYVWDKNKDEPVKKNDDAMDAMRYLVAGFDAIGIEGDDFTYGG